VSEQLAFDVGDWIVHAYYGVGQIDSVEERPVHGETTDCYRVLTRDAEYWVPIDDGENPRIRPVASRSRIYRALRALKKPAEKMHKNYRTRQARISEVLSSSSLLDMARLLRDLRGRQKARKLNTTDREAFELIKERFTREWAAAMEIKPETARGRLKERLQAVEAAQ